MNPYSRVLDILERAVGGKTIRAHRNFWRGKTRDDFVKLRVFGLRLLEMNDGKNSSLVRALRGEIPFGSDVDPSLPGEIYRRMPAALAPVSSEDIEFIEKWIDAGCPSNEQIGKPLALNTRLSLDLFPNKILSDDEINRFFREFDDYFMFAVSDQVSNDINMFFSGVRMWPGFGSDEAGWTSFLSEVAVQDAIARLSQAQIDIMMRHFGNPLDLRMLSEAFVRFGSGVLSEDTLRPQDPRHRMDGHTMWNIWLCFGCACIQLGVSAGTWKDVATIVAVGMVHDSLYRDDRLVSAKLHVKRYHKGQADLEDMIFADFSVELPSGLPPLLVDLSLESLMPPETPAV